MGYTADGSNWTGYTARYRLMDRDIGWGLARPTDINIKNPHYMRARLAAGAGGAWGSIYAYLGNLATYATTSPWYTDAKNLKPLLVGGVAQIANINPGQFVWTDWIALPYEGYGLVFQFYTGGPGQISQAGALSSTMYGYWAAGNLAGALSQDLTSGWNYQATMWQGCMDVQFG